MKPADNIEALFVSIVNERGGIDALSITEQSLARALAVALNADPINPATVSALQARFLRSLPVRSRSDPLISPGWMTAISIS
jgi:hypothetical protein